MSFNVIYPNTLDLKPGAEANDEFLVYSPVLNKIVRIKIATLLSGKSVPVWDPGEPYTIDFIVEWNLKFWKSLQNANTGNIPNENAFWTEVSPETVVATEVDSLRKTLTKTAHGFVVKDVITIDNSGAYVKVSNTSTQKPIGIVRTVIDANTFELVLAGYIDNLSGLTPGAIHFVNNSGSIVTTPTNIRCLLAINSTSGYITFDLGYTPQRVDAIDSTGVAIQFDQPRTYGETTPETGNITLNATGAQKGQVALIRHNNGTAPTFGTEFKRIGGSYVTGQLNFIFCTYVSPTEVLYTVSQVQV